MCKNTICKPNDFHSIFFNIKLQQSWPLSLNCCYWNFFGKLNTWGKEGAEVVRIMWRQLNLPSLDQMEHLMTNPSRDFGGRGAVWLTSCVPVGWSNGTDVPGCLPCVLTDVRLTAGCNWMWVEALKSLCTCSCFLLLLPRLIRRANSLV